MSDGPRVLIVDDEASIRDFLAILLRKEGYKPFAAGTKEEASRVLAKHPVDVVITDVRLPDGDGIDILRHVKASSPETAVVVMTAFGTTEAAVAAMKLGAEDYLLKPFDVEALKVIVRGAIQRRALTDENRRLKAELQERDSLEGIVGVSRAMSAVFDLVRTIASTNSTVLVTGESGTGKELVSKAIHTLSPRRDAPFVSINCGAMPEPLLESELFGHVKGAFTDAHQNKKGLFEVAHRGTLFLDEVGETPPSMQVKLLRALQERRIRRVGATDEIEVDVRVISATNVPLEELVRQRRLREDLFYRLQVIPIRIPPLRERREDIPLLANCFLESFAKKMGKGVSKVSEEAMAQLVAYAWPGNVRELENVIERAVALEEGSAILVERLVLPGSHRAQPVETMLAPGFSLEDHLRHIEAGLVFQALERAAGSRQVAAELLGVSARSLRYLLAKYRELDNSCQR